MVVSDGELRRRAAAFLERYWPRPEIPVDIEHIVDVQLGIDVVPMRQLSAVTQADGFISTDGRRIYVDEEIYQTERRYTYHFMLAHEIAHLTLHGPLFAAADYETMMDWKRFHDGLPEEDRMRFEYEASVFAGLILSPSQLPRELTDRPVGKTPVTARAVDASDKTAWDAAVRPRVLVLVEDPIARSVIKAMVKRREFEVLAFSRAVLCPRCQNQKGSVCTDAIVTDVSMSGITGLEFVVHQQMVGCKLNPENVALISGAWERNDLERIRALGCKTFTKPFLGSTLGEWLDDCKARIRSGRTLSSHFKHVALNHGVRPDLNGRLGPDILSG